MVKPRTALLIGGHGRTGQLITKILLSHGHTVYTLIRNTDQLDEIQSLSQPYPNAKLIPLIHDLNGISSHEVQELLGSGSQHGDGLGKGGISWVIWAAGSKSNIPRHPQDQLSVERDAAIRFIDEARGEGVGPGGGVRRFVLISACICRRECAGWWDGEEREYWECLRREVMPTYVEAKTEVDELLVSECRKVVEGHRVACRGCGGQREGGCGRACGAGRKKKVGEEGEGEGGACSKKEDCKGNINNDADDEDDESFSAVSIRPGTLGDHPGTGKVQLGRTRLGKEALSREDLARVVVALCEAKGRPERGGGVGCRWLDVGVGEEDVESAVERCIREDVDTSMFGIGGAGGAGRLDELKGGGFAS